MHVRKSGALLAGILTLGLLFQPLAPLSFNAYASESNEIVIDALDYGVDPTGEEDSTQAIQAVFAAAKEETANGVEHVTVSFPKGEYHIYKDYAEKREYHTSNTNSIENPIKTIGLLIEDQENLTVDGNGSLFMMHGNMMALAVVNSKNIRLEDFSWDFGVPTVTEMTVTDMGTENGKPYTDFLIPECFPHAVTGNTITWYSEKSPYTGQYYWTQTGIHNPSYAVVAYQPSGEMSRNYYTSDGPFTGVSSIREIDDTHVRIVYGSSRPAMQEMGTVIELAANAHRQTAGAFTWESENVTADGINVHYMHGFGWLVQMSRDVYYYNCNLVPREGSGHITVSFADGIHASGAAGELVIENCNFANTHDDPINLHGTFTRVERRMDDYTLQLKYIHNQQGGFPQFHEGDQVAFFTRDTLESTDNETLYTVASVISNPGEDGNDLRTMVVSFEEELPENLTDRISGQPKYVAENVTYAPAVTIRNCTFRNVPTRGILCTTRNPVLIENNTFLNMSMATIFLSNDSDEWYESGPIRDMTIRGNTFYIKSIGRTAWEYAPAVYVHPVTKGGGLPSEDNPIHKNITIEDNIFNMDVDTVVKAESVENLTIRNNKILRTNPNISLEISAPDDQLLLGNKMTLTTRADGDTHERDQDNVYEFTKCKNVVLEGNTYDDGLKLYAVLSNMSESNLTNNDPDIQIAHDRSQPASAPVRNIQYTSSNPEVLAVDANGKMTAKKAGEAEVYAYYEWNGEMILSNKVTMTVVADVAPEDKVTILGDDNVTLTEAGATHTFTAQVASGKEIVWSVEDFATGSESDAAVIDADGTLTARKNGVVWVKAACGVSVDRKAVIISLADTGAMNPDFRITREDKTNYTLSAEKIEIDMQAGDLYNNDNTVKNLFLYEIPQSVDKNNMRTVIRMENMPIRESGQWDTASFILYNDDDNYLTAGKKSHYNGIATVTETNGSATETGGSESENALTDAYVGFYKNGNTVSVDFKKDGGEWQHVSDLSAAMLGESFKIGFTAWESNNRGKKVAFSGFRVGNGDISYDQLCAQDAISFLDTGNQEPEAANAAFDKAEYEVGDTVTVTYDYSDADGDKEGKTLYCFTYENGISEVTDTPQLIAEYVGKISCAVYPADEKGRTGAPVSAEALVKEKAKPVDSTALQGEIKAAESLKLDGYTAESVAAYKNALEKAKKVLADGTATQEQVDAALNGLKAAKAALKAKPAVKPVPAKNSTFEVKGIRYKVTKSAAKNGTVSAVKLTGKKKTTLTIPATVSKDGYIFKVTSIGKKAFAGNSRVKSVVIGSNVTSIGKQAFYKCKKLKTITFKSLKAPKIGSKAFKGIQTKCRINVPKKMSAKKLNSLKKQLYKRGVGKKAVFKKK